MTDAERVVIKVRTEVSITGRIGQFGQGVIQDIAKRMFAQFAANVQGWIERGERPVETSVGIMSSLLKGASRRITGR